MENHGFFRRLFDLSFKEFVTTKIVTFLFILAIVLAGIVAIGILISGLSKGGGMAFASLIIAPIVFFLNVLSSRIWLELVIVMFRIAENTTTLVEQEQENKDSASEKQ